MRTLQIAARWAARGLAVSLLVSCSGEVGTSAGVDLRPPASFQAQLGLAPEEPKPGNSVELMLYTVNEGRGTLTADVALEVNTRDGDVVHRQPWSGVVFTPGEGWLLSSSFFLDANAAEAPYKAKLRIADTADGTVYYEDEVRTFGGGEATDVTDALDQDSDSEGGAGKS